MKRNRIWGLGLALTLVMGCWVGSTSARPLTAADSLLVPYYEAQGNLATLIGVQHVGTQTTGVSIINVTVHDPDGGVAAGGYICLDDNEFGYVVLQNATPPLDEDFGIYFSVARDAIDRTGFVGLAYAGMRNSCSDGAGTTQGTARTADFAMVAWAVLQDVGNGFFATEVPVVQVGWEVPQTVGSLAMGLQPYCYLNTDTTRARDYSDSAFNSDKTACADPSTHTFVASGSYCYSNTPPSATAGLTRARVDTQLNAAGTGCDDEFTHTFVPANTTLPAIPAAGPRADVSDADACDTSADNCPGLAFNTAATDDTIGARFDVLSSNRSVSNVYLWLDTAPLDGREAEFSVICEDGMTRTREITINDHVTVINPAGMGCSGRGVLELTLPERTAVGDLCYASGDANMAGIDEALDDRNNRCYRYSRKRDTSADPYYCYNSTTIRSADATSTNTGVTTAADVSNIDSGGVVTSCKSFRYVKDVTADSPSGYMFSHISQSDAHFRMNFPGYEK